jgi:hypothetical protein
MNCERRIENVEDESKRSNESEEQELPPLFPEKGPVTEFIMESLGLDEEGQDTVIVDLEVKTITVESKLGDQNYGNGRGYWELKPTGLHVHVPVHNARQVINDDQGDLAILAQVHRQVASALDGQQFAVVSRREDRKIMSDDAEAYAASKRFKVSRQQRREVKTEKPKGEVL